MDGEITAILVKVGAEVASGDALIELKTVVQRSASEPAVDRDSSEAPVLVEAEKTAPTIDDAEPGRTTKSEMESVSTGGQGEQALHAECPSQSSPRGVTRTRRPSGKKACQRVWNPTARGGRIWAS